MNWLWQFDLNGFRAIHVGLHSPFLDPIFLVLTYTGLGQVEGAIILAMLFSERTKAWVLPLISTLIVSGFVLGDGLKALVPRERPSNLAFAHPQEPIYARSFPSGHTTDAFAMAFMLLFLTRRTPYAWTGWAAFAWAALVGVSRIYRGVHWPTDVIGGALMGLAGSALVYMILDKRGYRFPMQDPKTSREE